MHFLAFLVVCVVTLSLVGAGSSDAHAQTPEARLSTAVSDQPIESYDPGLEADTSITSTEDPGEVIARAEQVLGERYVTISVDEARQAFTVYVLNLEDREVEGLGQAIRGEYPVTFENAVVSQDDVDQLLDVVAKYADANPGVLQLFGAVYQKGAVMAVAADSRSLSTALEGIRSEAGAAARLSELSDDRFALSGFRATLLTDTWSLTEEESNSDAPYRAGKSLRVASGSFNCTTGFLMKLDGLAYGSTAGHCGQNGSTTWFGGASRGNIVENTLWARNPALADASLYRMASSGTAYVRRSSTLEASPVTSTIAATTLQYGTRTCTRGSFTGHERCGNLTLVNVQTYSNTAGRNVGNGYCWAREVADSTRGGDSGAPVYQIASGNIKAAGLHRSGNGTDTSCFTSITAVMSFTGATVWTVG
jgi:hypothetical protein